uniref:Uncharacterized protein n=1 Tax=Solanum tuberosum TaxID=4113 RepID=M0ZTA1_SOLTU
MAYLEGKGTENRVQGLIRNSNLPKTLSPIKEDILFLKFLPHSERGKGRKRVPLSAVAILMRISTLEKKTNFAALHLC